MVTFIRPGTHIPSADTLRRDITANFKATKENFQQELQVSNFTTLNNSNLIVIKLILSNRKHLAFSLLQLMHGRVKTKSHFLGLVCTG
jgi:flagellar basal body rod protein FlgB